MRFSAIISSVKPFKDDEYTIYQKSAIDSWLPLTDNVVLFNRRDDIGDITPITRVDPSCNPPTVKEMLSHVAERLDASGVIALVNSDIVLSKDILKCLKVANDRNLGRSWAATSFRYESYPNTQSGVPAVRGQGLDIFVLTQPLISHVLRDIPPFMTVGRTLWDNWMNGWLRAQLKESHYFDMTPWMAVFHNIHEGGAGEKLSRYTDEQVRTIFASGRLDHHGIPNTKYNA